MIASSLQPEEFIIAMDFNNPQEVEQHIKSKNITCTHWVMFNVEKNTDKLITVYEQKDNSILINKFEN